jgi:hypothetical protein
VVEYLGSDTLLRSPLLCMLKPRHVAADVYEVKPASECIVCVMASHSVWPVHDAATLPPLTIGEHKYNAATEGNVHAGCKPGCHIRAVSQ